MQFSSKIGVLRKLGSSIFRLRRTKNFAYFSFSLPDERRTTTFSAERTKPFNQPSLGFLQVDLRTYFPARRSVRRLRPAFYNCPLSGLNGISFACASERTCRRVIFGITEPMAIFDRIFAPKCVDDGGTFVLRGGRIVEAPAIFEKHSPPPSKNPLHPRRTFLPSSKNPSIFNLRPRKRKPLHIKR